MAQNTIMKRMNTHYCLSIKKKMNTHYCHYIDPNWDKGRKITCIKYVIKGANKISSAVCK